MPDISDERVREIEKRVEMALDGWGEYRHLPVAIDGNEHLPAVTIEDVLSLARRVLEVAPTPPPARGEEATCKCGDSFGEEAMCWVCVADLESRLAATEARLAEVEGARAHLTALLAQQDRVLVGNEAGIYTASLLNQLADRHPDFAEVFRAIAADVAGKLKTGDEELAYQKGLAEGRAERDAAVAIAREAVEDHTIVFGLARNTHRPAHDVLSKRDVLRAKLDALTGEG